MTEIPEHIMQAARDALHEALRDPGCGIAIRMAMHSTSKAAFEAAIARAIMAERRAERERCAKVAENRHEHWKMPHPDDAKPGEVCCDVTACADIAAAIRGQS